MGKVHADMSMSLDGFVAGPNAGPQNALGDEGDQIQQWMYDVESWRELHSLEGCQTNRDDEVSKERFARTGAYVMGRRMFDEGEVGWPDPPPFRAPVFVLTHQAREPWDQAGRDDLHVRHRGHRERPGAGKSSRRREGHPDIGRRGHRPAVHRSRDARGVADPPRPRAARWWGAAVRSHRYGGCCRVGGHEGDRLPAGHTPQVPCGEVMHARLALFTHFPREGQRVEKRAYQASTKPASSLA